MGVKALSTVSVDVTADGQQDIINHSGTSLFSRLLRPCRVFADMCSIAVVAD